MMVADLPAPAAPKPQRAPSLKDELRGLSPAKLLSALESPEMRRRLPAAERRAWLKSARKAVRRIRCQSRSIVWYEDVALRRSEPSLPDGIACACRRCDHGRDKTRWPGYYMRGRLGYECWLESQSDWFLRSLPSGASIVRMGEI